MNIFGNKNLTQVMCWSEEFIYPNSYRNRPLPNSLSCYITVAISKLLHDFNNSHTAKPSHSVRTQDQSNTFISPIMASPQLNADPYCLQITETLLGNLQLLSKPPCFSNLWFGRYCSKAAKEISCSLRAVQLWRKDASKTCSCHYREETEPNQYSASQSSVI